MTKWINTESGDIFEDGIGDEWIEASRFTEDELELLEQLEQLEEKA